MHSRSNFQDAIKSIHRPTSDGERATAKPMTSVFYYVIRLEAVRGSSNVPIEGHFWRFLRNVNSQNVVGYRAYPKKALPCLTTLVLSYFAPKSMHGLLQ